MTSPDFLFFDYETVSSNPRKAAVISFGAVAGNWSDVSITDIPGSIIRLEKSAFYQTISVKKQISELGLEASADTLAWWESQGQAAKDLLNSKSKVSVCDHCAGFTQWCADVGLTQKTIVYVRAPQFDHTILENVFERCGYPVPYNTWKVRDVRSIIDIVFDVNNGYIPGFRDTLAELDLIEHYAVHDVLKDIIQVKMCKECMI